MRGMVAGEERQDTTRCRPGGTIPRRVTVEPDGDVVVFLIGMPIDRPWKVQRWLPVFPAMPRMAKELQARPELGLLAVHQVGLPTFVRCRRSCGPLEAGARAPDPAHRPAWVARDRRVEESRGEVGIRHETCLVAAGCCEAICSGMPRIGPGAAGRIVDAVGRRARARGWMAALAEPASP